MNSATYIRNQVVYQCHPYIHMNMIYIEDADCCAQEKLEYLIDF